VGPRAVLYAVVKRKIPSLRVCNLTIRHYVKYTLRLKHFN